MGKTKPEVFIIETLKFDEEQKYKEGKILSKILALSGKKCRYYYIRTKRELKKILNKFSNSKYRYLHLSCHGNSTSMSTTLDEIDFPELAKILRPHLKGKRLFLSACSISNENLAKEVMPKSDCISILGPAQTIEFGAAAISWASIYHVMFTEDKSRMEGRILREKATDVANMFGVRFWYFGKKKSSKRGYISKEIKPQNR